VLWGCGEFFITSGLGRVLSFFIEKSTGTVSYCKLDSVPFLSNQKPCSG
jgi:hypothetical protein